MTSAKYIIATLAILLAGACATPERVVLLPEAGGKANRCDSNRNSWEHDAIRTLRAGDYRCA